MKEREQLTDDEIIARAAEILAGRHQNPALAPILEAQMLRVKSCVPSSGGGGYVDWIANLQALGEIIISVAKAEAKTAKRWKIT